MVHRFLKMGLAPLLLLLAGGSGNVLGQDTREVGLRVELSVQGPATPDRPAKLLVSITNTGTTPVTLPARPDWDEAGGLEIEVSKDGGAARRLAPPDQMPSRSAPGTGGSRLILKPGQTLGVFRQFGPGELFSASGAYRLTATYRLRDAAPLVSAPLVVSVE